MNRFNKVPLLKKKSHLPEYVITSRLPVSKESILLGRIVADFEDPCSFYRPKEQLQTSTESGKPDGSKTDLPKNVSEQPAHSDGVDGKVAGASPAVIQFADNATDTASIPQADRSGKAGNDKANKVNSDDADSARPRDANVVKSNDNDKQQRTEEGKVLSDGRNNEPSKPALKSKTLAESLGGEEIEIVDEGFESLFSVTKNHTAQLKVGQIVGVDFAQGQSRSVTVKSKYVRTRTLTQHPDVLDALLKDYREEILYLLRKQKNGRAYMIVGLKTAVGGELKSNAKIHTKTTVAVALPVGPITLAASHGTVNLSDEADPQGVIGKDHEATRFTSFGMVGEQIFAIRYRLISLKRPRRSEDAQVNYGEVLRVPEADGVYGDDRRPQVFAENGFDDGSAFQDDNIELLDEGLKSEIKQLGLDIAIAKFER